MPKLLPVSLIHRSCLETVASNLRESITPRQYGWEDMAGDAAVLGDALLEALGTKPALPIPSYIREGSDICHWVRWWLYPAFQRVGEIRDPAYTHYFRLPRLVEDTNDSIKMLWLIHTCGLLPPCPHTTPESTHNVEDIVLLTRGAFLGNGITIPPTRTTIRNIWGE